VQIGCVASKGRNLNVHWISTFAVFWSKLEKGEIVPLSPWKKIINQVFLTQKKAVRRVFWKNAKIE
jgi:hypothetical protein